MHDQLLLQEMDLLLQSLHWCLTRKKKSEKMVKLYWGKKKKKPAKSSTKFAAGEYPRSQLPQGLQQGISGSGNQFDFPLISSLEDIFCWVLSAEPAQAIKERPLLLNGMISWSGIAGSVKFQALGYYPGSQALCRAHLCPELSSSASNWDKGEISLCCIWLSFSITWNIFKDSLF